MYSYNWQTGNYENNDGEVVSWSEVQANNYTESESKKEKQTKALESVEEKWDNRSLKATMVISGALLADDATVIGVIDDAAIPFIIIGGFTVYLYDNKELVAKQAKEISKTLAKKSGPLGFVYELRVNQGGTYINVRGMPTKMKAGDVWKYGETTNGNHRYTPKQLNEMVPGGVTMVPIYAGNQVEIKVQEKIMIYWYAMKNGKLPPGNRIFR